MTNQYKISDDLNRDNNRMVLEQIKNYKGFLQHTTLKRDEHLKNLKLASMQVKDYKDKIASLSLKLVLEEED